MKQSVLYRAGRNMNTIDLQGRHAIVTGGARGIGLAIAKRFIKSGASVSLWDIDEEAAQTAVLDLQATGNIDWQRVDITSEEAIAEGTRTALSLHGAIDILINNAGITGGNGRLWELSPDIWRKVVEVNLIAPFLVCGSIVPEMLKAGYGRIVNISSIAGMEGSPNASHYSASKAGLIGMTKSLGKELANTGVLVNCIAPAAAETDIFKQMTQQHIEYMLSKIPMGRFLKVDEVAALVSWLSSEECSFSTGAVYDLTGGRAVY